MAFLAGSHIKFSENTFNAVLNLLARQIAAVDFFGSPTLPDRLVSFSIDDAYCDRTFSYCSLAVVISHKL